MVQWFKFVKQLLQMLLKALSCVVCIDARYSAILNQFSIRKLEAKDLSALPETHACTGLKSVTTSVTTCTHIQFIH
jgi:hypothetical protein